MNRRGGTYGFAIVAALAAAAVAPVGAGAIAGGDWNGNIKGDPDSFVTFTVERNDGKKRVADVMFGGLDITCEGGIEDEADGVLLLGKFRVRHGEFGRRADAVVAAVDPPARLAGELKPGRRAVGTIRVRGELDPIKHPGLHCRTGLQRWKAEKAPPLEP